MRRRTLGLAALAAACAPAAADTPSFEEEARRLAAAPFRAPADDLPAALRGLDYDGYRRLDHAFPPRALGAFRVLPFPRGYLFPDAVALDLPEGPWTPAPGAFRHAPAEAAGFAGFRLLAELNAPGRWDEVASFLGASYFRALGQGHAYGISARALSVGLGGAAPEEFPAFRRFRLSAPGEAAQLEALIDGPALAAAARLTVTPGAETRVRVALAVFPRRPLPDLGLAPASSMFWFTGGRVADPRGRPAVHDSDALLWEDAAGRRTLRPLDNPAAKRVTDIPLPAPRGFGLLQRARGFDAFRDAEARYGDRPSLWAEPEGDWGPGTLRLLELPARDEYHDTIALCWTPAAAPRPGAPFRAAWTLRWADDAPARPDEARVLGAARDGARVALRFDAIPPGAVPRAEGAASLALDGATLHLDGPPGARAWLERDGRPVSETWQEAA